MNSSIRAELLGVLSELSSVCPEMRFGQLIANLSTVAKGLSAEDLWDVEDAALLDAARKQLAYFVEHRGTACPPLSAGPVAAASMPSPIAK